MHIRFTSRERMAFCMADVAADELTEIDSYAVESGVDFWAEARETTP
jgi:hypothetical protein